MAEPGRDVPIPLVIVLAVVVVGGGTWLADSFDKPAAQSASAEPSVSEPPAAPVPEAPPAPEESSKNYVLDSLASQVYAEQALATLLKDPASATYGPVWLTRVVSDGQVMFGFCGTVNGRNSFGAYAGEQRFVALPLGAAVEGQGASFETPYKAFCVDGERIRTVSFRAR